MSTKNEKSDEKKRKEETKKSWKIKVSKYAQNSNGGLHEFVELYNFKGNPKKSEIKLTIGDQKAFGTLPLPDGVKEYVITAIRRQKCNGYSVIAEENARQSIAKYISRPGFTVNGKDIILCVGCSQALEVAFSVLANSGDNVLLPKPGFPGFEVICKSNGIDVLHYDLMSNKKWQINLQQMNRMINSKTAAIVYNNPSNPCASVFPKEHIQDFLTIAEKNCVPIIADEIYERLVLDTRTVFHPIYTLSTNVPIITCSSLANRFALPGWRCGWMHVHDPKMRFNATIRAALEIYSKRIGGHNRIFDCAFYDVLTKWPQTFHDKHIELMKTNLEVYTTILATAPGVKCESTQGGPYFFIRVDYRNYKDIGSDILFVQRLAQEESVWVLPGKCFGAPGYMRIALFAKPEQTKSSALRIRNFCKKYYSLKKPFVVQRKV